MIIDDPFTRFPSLTTNRLLLRRIVPGDAEALFAIRSDAETMKFFGQEPHESLDETKDVIRRMEERYTQKEALRWCITLQGGGGLIGSCTLFHFDEGFDRAETGYELNRAFWGKGIMTEAMSAILTFGFSELGLHRVEAVIDIANERSKKLLLKLGFTYEGNLRQRFPFRGHFEDEHYFGLLKDEWHGSVHAYTP
ncbi:MAG TPA: GNAT family N-acetyltransferase [Ktedonobacteraceae bacterium]|jgi:ribosomal-protein-alanine N-acetyltransferase|nr:GNAT family N-acetyltransferase [Ktedonobacteraceae bacterium]